MARVHRELGRGSARARASRRSARARRRAGRAARCSGSSTATHQTLASACGQQRGEQRLAAGRTDVGVHGVLGVRHQADDVAARRCGRRRCWPTAPFGLCPSSTSPSGDAVAEHDPALALEPRELVGADDELALAVLDGDLERSRPGTSPPVTGVCGRLDPQVHLAGRRTAATGCGSARPGSSPDSHRIWKPLQIPSTGPPRSANARTSSITGANRAIAPHRR